MADGGIDSELEELGSQLHSFDLKTLADQLNSLPEKAKARIMDAETSRKLEQMVTPTLGKEQSTHESSGKKKKKKKDKVETPLQRLSSAASSALDSAEETRTHLELEELEHLSQLSERNAQDIENLKRIIDAHDELLRKQQKDIAILLSQNTELKRELSSIKSIGQPVVLSSQGSRAGHFTATPDAATPASSREVKASDLDTASLTPNPLVSDKAASGQIKKRLIV